DENCKNREGTMTQAPKMKRSAIPRPLSISGLKRIAREFAVADRHMGEIHGLYGPPPLWDREPGFATLLNIILEQQVSLASARACFDKLNDHLGEVTPSGLLELNDVQLKAIGFSRQKTAYARHLSEAVIEKRINF